jgi:membrane protease YdiL (CAAX protease family)
MDVWQYIYQFGITVLLFLIVPYCIFRFYLNEDFLSLGIRFVPNREALIVCAVLYPVVIASTYFSSQDPLIAGEYPLSKGIGASWTVFLLYELAYFFYFLSYEIFYRGFFSFGLKTEQGGKRELITIIILQTVLTTLFHIGKPTPEIAMAAAFGPVFGYVAFRYNSIWYGMVIHYVNEYFHRLFFIALARFSP